jgi:hypothetical protein
MAKEGNSGYGAATLVNGLLERPIAVRRPAVERKSTLSLYVGGSRCWIPLRCISAETPSIWNDKPL